MAIYELDTHSGKKIYIEVEESNQHERIKASNRSAVKKAETLFREAFENISTPIEEISERLLTIPNKPSEVEVGFSVKFSAELNMFLVTKGGVEGSFNIKAKWINNEKPKVD